MAVERTQGLTALRRAVYLLDRSLAPSQKVRAFRRAIEVIEGLSDEEFAAHTSAKTLTSLDGIGPSTSAVASNGGSDPESYLAKLERSTAIDPGIGADLRQQIRGDCHLHSDWSDGGASTREMAIAARALGHEYIVMTDHSPRLTIAHGLSPERLAAQRTELDALNEELAPFRILRGSEVDILEDGSLDLPDAILAKLDIVVASVHSKLKMAAPEMTRRLIMAVSNPHVDILGHCTGRQIIGTDRAPSTFDATLVFTACAQSNTAVEINCRPERQDPPNDLLDVALGTGCDVAINTDAHAPGQLEWQASGCIKAQQHGIEADRIINTRGADELLAWSSRG